MISNLNRLIVIIFIFKFITISIVNSMEDDDEKLENLRNNEIIQNRMKQVKMMLEQNVIAGIKYGKHAFVDENIVMLSRALVDINGIVRRFYNRTIENFEMLIAYAGNCSDTTISFHITEELWRQLKVVGEILMPVTEFCAIYDVIVDRFIDSRNLNLDQIEYANVMEKDISKVIVTYGIRLLSSALSSKTYYKVKDIANTIFETNKSFFGKIICSVIDNMYKAMRFRDLVQTMWAHKFNGQKVAAFSCILRNLQRNMHNNPEATMVFALYLHMLKKSTSDEQELKKIEQNIQSLPLLVRNLFFQQFCLRNVKSKDYIAPDFEYDEYKHEVFLSLGGYLRGIAEWIADPVGEFLFRLRNVIYSNEMLYVGHQQRGILSKERLVYTWQAQDYSIGDAKEHVTWRVTLHKPEPEYQISITNEAYDELLCVSEETTKQEGSREYANAVTIEGDSGSDECRWTVEICPFGLPH